MHRQFIQYREFLKDGGEIYFKTDDDDLFRDSLEYFPASGYEITWKTFDLHENEPEWNIRTEHEGNDLYNEMKQSGVLEKTALVYGQMNEPPGARMRVGLSGLTMAEYFRDEEHQDVLLFIDNIFRFTQAGSEVSALLGRMPSAVGYQPTLANEMGALQERITSTKKGSITSVQAVYVPADDSRLYISFR